MLDHDKANWFGSLGKRVMANLELGPDISYPNAPLADRTMTCRAII